MIKNMSQFKKWLEKGKQIQFIENTMKPEMAGGQVREINKVQTNAITTLVNGNDSWLDIPKAKDTKFNEDGTIDIYLNGKFWLKIKPII
ncbi:hypothetical protein SAMN04487895_101709 [Paenibacillus sophorae]|uniref:Uncharacterized protein n=1 Tax=Paenibacillus sophorae TaxID=1333845 RepID=A0A1H8H0S9_9BACL|nr:hypothetical protein [Paenibacillus sophorae]QWU14400.1 hypothetical protein KP014_21060 [Paenibacillus sophorae]SEN49629.1 hypothetical protein SAMN04487895_101709 [Paenibacillus sophorae]